MDLVPAGNGVQREPMAGELERWLSEWGWGRGWFCRWDGPCGVLPEVKAEPVSQHGQVCSASPPVKASLAVSHAPC